MPHLTRVGCDDCATRGRILLHPSSRHALVSCMPLSEMMMKAIRCGQSDDASWSVTQIVVLHRDVADPPRRRGGYPLGETQRQGHV
jgi:hypothetical protein